jgi:hypothetical protein
MRKLNDTIRAQREPGPVSCVSGIGRPREGAGEFPHSW